jgi:hypothetical protein
VERAAKANLVSVKRPKANLLRTVPVRARLDTLVQDHHSGPAAASTISVEADPTTVQLRSACQVLATASLPTVV